jgi:hypothetical protein
VRIRVPDLGVAVRCVCASVWRAGVVWELELLWLISWLSCLLAAVAAALPRCSHSCFCGCSLREDGGGRMEEGGWRRENGGERMEEGPCACSACSLRAWLSEPCWCRLCACCLCAFSECSRARRHRSRALAARRSSTVAAEAPLLRVRTAKRRDKQNFRKRSHKQPP